MKSASERIHTINSYLGELGIIEPGKRVEVVTAFSKTFKRKQIRANKLAIQNWWKFRKFAANYIKNKS